MRLVVIGGVAAGASAAVKARRTREDAKIVIYEKGSDISYANCGMPYHIGGVIEKRDELLVVNPAYLKKRFNVDVFTRHEVTAVDTASKTVSVTDVATGRIFADRYDRLVIATGALPLSFPSIEGDRVFRLYTLEDMDRIAAFITRTAPRRALVLGGGYIGIEMAENLVHRGMTVTIVEKAPQILLPFDPEMASLVAAYLTGKGVRVVTGVGVAAVEGGEAVLENGERLGFDIGIASLGVRPNTELAKAARLELGLRGSIKVTEGMETSVAGVYAAGDCAENVYRVTKEPCWIPLAGAANKQGRIAGFNAVAAGAQMTYKGTLGTAIAKFGGITFGVTGFAEKQLRAAGTDCVSLYCVADHHAGYYPGAQPLHIKVMGDKESGRVLGAQIIGADGVDKRIDVFASAIYAGLTFDDLESLDLAYAPPFSSAKDPVIVCGMIGNNIVNGVATTAAPPGTGGDAFILDVRTKGEFNRGCFPGSVNIPVDELRSRLAELEQMKERPILVHCATGYRSYIALRILTNSGFRNVTNLAGGWFFNRPGMKP